LKKKKYNYYTCSGAKGCKRFYVPENILLEQVDSIFEKFNLTEKQIDEITEMLRDIGVGESKFNINSVNGLKAEYDKLQKRLKKMYEDKLDGVNQDFNYAEMVSEYKSKQNDILEQIKDHTDADGNFHLTANMILSICKRAKEIFKSSEVAEKQQILSFLLQNCTLNEKTLYFTMRSPFNALFNQPDNLTVRYLLVEILTFFEQNPE
jgi:bacterioferritin (cytochrome b1)